MVGSLMSWEKPYGDSVAILILLSLHCLCVCVCVCVPLHGTEANDLLKEQALVFFKDRDRGLCLSTDALVRGRPQPHRPS